MKTVKYLLVMALMGIGVLAQFALKSERASTSSQFSDGTYAAIGGLRSIVAEIIWFRADRLQAEGRYVELAQLASALAAMEPHTPEVWGYAAWNLAYNVSVMMTSDEDRWRWVEAAIKLLRDEGLALNPNSPELCRELAWLFELKIGADIDRSALFYRAKWKAIVEDVQARGAWAELKLDEKEMREIERLTGFTDWTDPQLSAIYFARHGNLADIIQQASVIYTKNHQNLIK